MMVRAPDIDGRLKAAHGLVAVIRNVGEEIGVAAVAFYQHPILVVTEARRPQPPGALACVEQAPPFQLLEGRLDLFRFVQRALRAELVEFHPQRPHVVLLALLHPLESVAAYQVPLFRSPGAGEPVTVRRLELVGQLDDVLALIPALGNRHIPPEQLCMACLDRVDQLVDLGARIVDVELATDLMAGKLEQARDRVTDRGAAPMADVQRPGGVGGHELDVDCASRAPVVAAVLAVLLENFAEAGAQIFAAHAEVDEPGPGDLRMLDMEGR